MGHTFAQIKFRCHSCRQKYRLDAERCGEEFECHKCKETLIVPEVSDAEFREEAMLKVKHAYETQELKRVSASETTLEGTKNLTIVNPIGDAGASSGSKLAVGVRDKPISETALFSEPQIKVDESSAGLLKWWIIAFLSVFALVTLIILYVNSLTD